MISFMLWPLDFRGKCPQYALDRNRKCV